MQSDHPKDEVESQPTAERHTRRQILQAAEELFLARGYKGVSMKDIADAVHVKAAALYYHFPEGKEELFAEMVRQVLSEATEQMLQALAEASDFRERLTLLTQRLLVFPLDRFSLLFRDAHEHLDKQKDFFEAVGLSFLQQVAGIFQEAAQAGEVTAQIPPHLLALLYEGMCIAVLNGSRLAPELVHGHNTGQLADILVSALLDGIVSNASTME